MIYLLLLAVFWYVGKARAVSRFGLTLFRALFVDLPIAFVAAPFLFVRELLRKENWR